MKSKKHVLSSMIAIVVAIILVSGCSSITVNQDYNTGFDFSKWKTFGFIPIPESAGIDQINATRLGDAIKKQLLAKGYKLEEPADFGVALMFSKQTVTDIQSYGYGYGGYGGVGGVDVTQYDQGTLLIDFIDMKENKLEWRGSGQGALQDNPSVEDRMANIDTAVAQIIAQFPPDMTQK
jgi:hypothetical protein